MVGCGRGEKPAMTATVDGDGCRNDTVQRCGDGVIVQGLEACMAATRSRPMGASTTSPPLAAVTGSSMWGSKPVMTETVWTWRDINTCQLATCGDGAVREERKPAVREPGRHRRLPQRLHGRCVRRRCGAGWRGGLRRRKPGARSPVSVVAPRAAATDLQAGVESCDDGNQVNTDACLNTCASARCGDRVVREGQRLDDGNEDPTDGCLNSCVLASCGDGFVQAGVEACDDGNAAQTDDCLNDCTAPRCGDGHVRVGAETCDDGNNVDGDSCDAQCQLEGRAGLNDDWLDVRQAAGGWLNVLRRTR